MPEAVRALSVAEDHIQTESTRSEKVSRSRSEQEKHRVKLRKVEKGQQRGLAVWLSWDSLPIDFSLGTVIFKK